MIDLERLNKSEIRNPKKFSNFQNSNDQNNHEKQHVGICVPGSLVLKI
jgi:hypothetical protein